jgi:hypothetical protein
MPQKSVRRKTQKCQAGVPTDQCAYKQDLNHWAEMFKKNEDAHTAICGDLRSLKEIKLNGNDEVTSLHDVLKDIWHATESLREYGKLRKQFNRWTQNTKLGRFLKTTAGMFLISLLVLWIMYCTLHAFGIIEATPHQFFEWALKINPKK